MAQPTKQYAVPLDIEADLLVIGQEIAPGAGLRPIQVIRALIAEHHKRKVE